MGKKTYPLDRLLGVRKDKVFARVKDLSGAIREREGLERARLAAEAEQARAREEATRERDRVAESLAKGSLSVGDLARQAAWEARVEWDDAERQRKITTTKENEARAKEGEENARGLVRAAEAESKVVVRDRERWVAEVDRTAALTAEEEAAEAWRRRE
jgi:hypothetical protein